MVTLEQRTTINNEIFIATLCDIVATVFRRRSVVVYDFLASATRSSGRYGGAAK
jgi:hypothetical protein